MKLKIFGLFFLSSFLLLTQPVFSCGFYETEADYQAMMFRAMLPGMRSLHPFNYTTSSNYYQFGREELSTDLNQNDRFRNCSEWLAVCDKSVFIQDIYEIQYKTDGNLFVKVYSENSWQENFPNNSFITFLVKKENKELLDYMLFAKKMELTEFNESRFEDWNKAPRSWWWGDSVLSDDEIDNVKNELLELAQTRLAKASSTFLKQRYAFQVCRLKYQLGKAHDVSEIFNQYFGKIDPNNLMSIWTGFFTGMSFPSDSDDCHKYLIQTFTYSDEKKLRCVELFDDNYDPDLLTKSEQSMAIVMRTLRNPGRVVDRIRNAYALDKDNKYIPFLVLREVNKLEDWMITPLFYKKYSITYTDIFTCPYKKLYDEEDYYSDIQKLRAENILTDKQYLNELKLFLIEILPQTKGETKDFYAISLAHLCLLQENPVEANKYLSQVSDKANPTIKLQQKLETIWLAIKTQNIQSEKFKKTFTDNIVYLEKVSSPGYDNKGMLYTITLSLANEYLKKNDHVYGNLMRLKSITYHYPDYEGWCPVEDEDTYIEEYRSGYTYSTIEFFDYNATTSDIDQLIALLEKKDKTPFEKYMCHQSLAPINAYKDLKGTLAFRENNLPLAYETFSSMPEDYWQGSNGLSFSTYLNEDPFEPKGLRGYICRNFDYQFNKAEFVKQLMDLQQQAETDPKNRVDYYIKLGNAYFNTSYFGNAWMMNRYRWSSGYEYYADNMECLPQWYRNYLTAAIARQYFEKALKEAVNDEQRAYASLMLYYIYERCFWNGQENELPMALLYGNNFMKYNKTNTFRMMSKECPGVINFLSSR